MICILVTTRNTLIICKVQFCRFKRLKKLYYLKLLTLLQSHLFISWGHLQETKQYKSLIKLNKKKMNDFIEQSLKHFIDDKETRV